MIELVNAARRFRELARDPLNRKRRDIVEPIFKFFETQLPLIGFVPMAIALQRLNRVQIGRLSEKEQEAHFEALKRIKRQISQDKIITAQGGIPQDILKFKLSYRSPWDYPFDRSREAQIAFWTQKRIDMAAQWGCERAHTALGLDPIISLFLSDLHRSLTFDQKLSLLQDFKDNDYRLADEISTAHGNFWLADVPNYELIIRLDLSPATTKLVVEHAYRNWALKNSKKMPKRVKHPLKNLVSQLRKPIHPYDIRAALRWHGSEYNVRKKYDENVLWLASCIVAAESWTGGVYKLDIELAKRVRGFL